jgi:hypothetical protein
MISNQTTSQDVQTDFLFFVSAAKFFWYMLFMFLTLSFFTYYGMMAVSISPNVQAS